MCTALLPYNLGSMNFTCSVRFPVFLVVHSFRFVLSEENEVNETNSASTI